MLLTFSPGHGLTGADLAGFAGLALAPGAPIRRIASAAVVGVARHGGFGLTWPSAVPLRSVSGPPSAAPRGTACGHAAGLAPWTGLAASLPACWPACSTPGAVGHGRRAPRRGPRRSTRRPRGRVASDGSSPREPPWHATCASGPDGTVGRAGRHHRCATATTAPTPLRPSRARAGCAVTIAGRHHRGAHRASGPRVDEPRVELRRSSCSRCAPRGGARRQLECHPRRLTARAAGRRCGRVRPTVHAERAFSLRRQPPAREFRCPHSAGRRIGLGFLEPGQARFVS